MHCGFQSCCYCLGLVGKIQVNRMVFAVFSVYFAKNRGFLAKMPYQLNLGKLGVLWMDDQKFQSERRDFVNMCACQSPMDSTR